MAISGKISDLKILIALFGNVTVIEILQFKVALKILPNHKVA